MHFIAAYDRPEASAGSGTVRVGWLLDEAKSGIVFFPPERVRSAEVNRAHAKSASRCPAVLNLESRYFVVRCPFDLHLQFARGEDGKPGVKNALGEASPVRPNKLHKHITVVNEAEWRYPERPTLQIQLPYLFIADEPVYLSQVPPFMHYQKDPWPGTLFGGRYPINLWPRPLMWAFEWHEPKKDLKLNRGEPMFYCLFETEPQDRPVQLVEAARTPELDEYLEMVSGAVSYVNQTFSLFKAAEARRPAKLVSPKAR